MEILNAIIAIEVDILRGTAPSRRKEATAEKEACEREVIREVCREIGVEEIEVEIETEGTEEKGVEEMWTEEIGAEEIGADVIVIDVDRKVLENVSGRKVHVNVGLRVTE
jgi:hypothetical protein